MTLNDLSSKSVTSYAVCQVLAERKRHRSEPLVLGRLESEVREYMVTHKTGMYNREDFFKSVLVICELGWGRIIKNRIGNPKKIEFTRPITEFRGDMQRSSLAGVVRVNIPMSTIPKPLRTQFKFEVEGGIATIEIEGDVEKVMTRLKLIL